MGRVEVGKGLKMDFKAIWRAERNIKSTQLLNLILTPNDNFPFSSLSVTLTPFLKLILILGDSLE